MSTMTHCWVRLLLYLNLATLISSMFGSGHGLRRKRNRSRRNGGGTNGTEEQFFNQLYLKTFEDDLTTDAYVYLAQENMTKEYEPMAKVKDAVYANLRRSWQEDAKVRFPDLVANTPELVIAVCVMLQSTYRAGLKNLHKFYVARLPFYRTEVFELGYLAHEIVYRYQVMIELFQMAKHRYVGQDARDRHRPLGNTMPGQYMFYVYINIVEQAKAVAHLCNMLAEVGPKFKARRERALSIKLGPKHSPWSDISATEEDTGEVPPEEPTKKQTKVPFHTTNLTRMREYLAKLRKKRFKLLMKKRMYFRFFERRYNKTIKTRPRQRKPKSFWPIDYGWYRNAQYNINYRMLLCFFL